MGLYEKIAQAIQQQRQQQAAPIPQSTPQQAPLGTGAADQARQKILAQEAYKQYSIDAQINGQQPIPFEQWFLQQQAQPQQ